MTLETMTKIGTYTVGAGGISSFSFSSIPQTYTDLIVKASARVSGSEGYATAELRMQFNSDTTAANYKYMQQWGLGTGSVGSNTGSNFFFGNIEGGGMTANVFSSSEVYIQNYSGNSFKNAMFFSAEEASAAAATIANGVTKWSNTAPITSITILSNTNSLAQYTTFTLYGVKSMRAAAGNSIKATGGAIAFDGTYVTHTFNTSGSFTPTTNLLVDYLVVAGGAGGGGDNHGAGGGAGGYRHLTSQSLTSGTAYTATVGAGGAGGAPSNRGANGSDSVFSSTTSTGGGGGSTYFVAAQNGGSGGGANYGQTTPGSGNTPSTSPSQGNNGGTGINSAPNYGQGGGGGSGAVGGNGTSTVGGAGGAGTPNSISGSSVTYAGGGGGSTYNGGTGGAGGSGGGGAGGSGGAGVNGTANTGGGGGGSERTGSPNGGTGGSGIVIIRYKG